MLGRGTASEAGQARNFVTPAGLDYVASAFSGGFECEWTAREQ
jgi:hypothetical protein